jgi:hypothetical protein
MTKINNRGQQISEGGQKNEVFIAQLVPGASGGYRPIISIASVSDLPGESASKFEGKAIASIDSIIRPIQMGSGDNKTVFTQRHVMQVPSDEKWISSAILSFSGDGRNDARFSGNLVYGNTNNFIYPVTIKATITDVNPDQFSWAINSHYEVGTITGWSGPPNVGSYTNGGTLPIFPTFVAISDSYVNGISISFGRASGHSINDTWSYNIYPNASAPLTKYADKFSRKGQSLSMPPLYTGYQLVSGENQMMGSVTSGNICSRTLNPYMVPTDTVYQYLSRSGEMTGRAHDIDMVANGPYATGNDNFETQNIYPSTNTYGNIDVPEMGGNLSNLPDMRTFALRSPLILTGWGYNTSGLPVPNEDFDREEPRVVVSGSGVVLGTHSKTGEYDKTKFLDGWLQKSNTWKTGPLDVRWDEDKGMWVPPNSYKFLNVYVPSGSPILPSGRTTLAISGSELGFALADLGNILSPPPSSLYIPFYNSSTATLEGQSLTCYYDGDVYRPIASVGGGSSSVQTYVLLGDCLPGGKVSALLLDANGIPTGTAIQLEDDGETTITKGAGVRVAVMGTKIFYAKAFTQAEVL